MKVILHPLISVVVVVLVLWCSSTKMMSTPSVHGFSSNPYPTVSISTTRLMVDDRRRKHTTNRLSNGIHTMKHRSSALALSLSITSYFTPSSSSSSGTIARSIMRSDGIFPKNVTSSVTKKSFSANSEKRSEKEPFPSKLQENDTSTKIIDSNSAFILSINPKTGSSNPDPTEQRNNRMNTDDDTISRSGGSNNNDNNDSNNNDNTDTSNNNNNNNNDTDLLSYLGTQELIDRIPPQTRDLLRRITYNYIYGPSNTNMLLSLQEIATIIELEHRSRDVPVQIVNGRTNQNHPAVVLFTADVTKTGEAFDELCAEILSIGALYQLPKEIVLELLSSVPLNGKRIDGTGATNSFDDTSNTYTMIASSMNKCRSAFATTGWDGVVFPMGLAIRPKTKFRSIWSLPLLRNNQKSSNGSNQEQQELVDMERSPTMKKLPLSWFHRNKTLREIAAMAVKSAAQVKPPPRQLIDRRLYLNTLDQQIRQLSLSTTTTQTQSSLENVAISTGSSSAELIISDAKSDVGLVRGTSTAAPATGQLFFPNSDRTWWQKVLSFSSKRRTLGNVIRAIRRTLTQQYHALKRQGRAGLISYCLFNFLYYTIGMVWQWPRMPIIPSTAADGSDVVSNLLSSSSTILSSSLLQNPQWTIPTLLLRKFGKIFAYLYAFSQLLKIPKLCSAVGLAPFSSKALDFIQKRCNVKETSATIIMISTMVLVWGLIVAFPILSEYASLKHVLYLEEQLLQVYGLQPA